MRAWLLLVVFAMGSCGCTTMPFISSHSAVVRLEMGDGICSGTYIGPHTILTAAHCIAPHKSGVLKVNDKRTGWALLAYDKHDHVMLRVQLASVAWRHRGPPAIQGDVVYKIGNPLGLRDILIVGRVAGFLKDGTMLIDSTGFKGDSGAGVFDRNGNIVGVISAMGGDEMFYLMVAYPITFTAHDWLAASK